jgi:endonuclease G
VDELEKRTGIDFFYNLPDEIENKLEKQTDYKMWSF